MFLLRGTLYPMVKAVLYQTAKPKASGKKRGEN